MIGCNKKVTETMNGEFHCEKCNKTFPTVRLFFLLYSRLSYSYYLILSYLILPIQCIRRYILSVSMADHSGSNWFTLFNDTVIASN